MGIKISQKLREVLDLGSLLFGPYKTHNAHYCQDHAGDEDSAAWKKKRI